MPDAPTKAAEETRQYFRNIWPVKHSQNAPRGRGSPLCLCGEPLSAHPTQTCRRYVSANRRETQDGELWAVLWFLSTGERR